MEGSAERIINSGVGRPLRYDEIHSAGDLGTNLQGQPEDWSNNSGHWQDECNYSIKQGPLHHISPHLGIR